MPVFQKKKEEKELAKPPVPKEKADDSCTVEGCDEKKASGQTYVCTKHIRTH